MLKTLGATLAIAFITATAGQALALNPQPLPPLQMPHYLTSHVVPGHVMPRCPPARGLGRTCV